MFFSFSCFKKILKYAYNVAVYPEQQTYACATTLTFKTTQLPPAIPKVATVVVCGVIPCSCPCSCPTTPQLGHWWG